MTSPSPPPKRIVGYDVARSLAVIGMVIVNYKLVMGTAGAGPVWLETLVGLLEGRAAATFVVLAGIGIALLSRHGRETGDAARLRADRATILKRALFLFVVGLAYTPIWPADILHFYGVYMVVAALLLSASTRRIWSVSWGLVIGFVALLFVWDYETGWNWETLEYSGFWTAPGMIRHLFYNGFHPVVPWAAFMLFGMILGRMNLRDSAQRRRVFGVSATMAVATELAGWFLVRSVGGDEELASIVGTAAMPPMPLYMIAGAATATAVIAACVGLGERFREAAWLQPLISTGQLALTLYVAHVVIGMGTLEALGLLENQTLATALFAAAVFCIAGILFAHLWRKRFKRGPLETVMRRVT